MPDWARDFFDWLSVGPGPQVLLRAVTFFLETCAALYLSGRLALWIALRPYYSYGGGDENERRRRLLAADYWQSTTLELTMFAVVIWVQGLTDNVVNGLDADYSRWYVAAGFLGWYVAASCCTEIIRHRHGLTSGSLLDHAAFDQLLLYPIYLLGVPLFLSVSDRFDERTIAALGATLIAMLVLLNGGGHGLLKLLGTVRPLEVSRDGPLVQVVERMRTSPDAASMEVFAARYADLTLVPTGNRSRIYVSEALLPHLEPDEFAALLWHAVARQHDTWRECMERYLIVPFDLLMFAYPAMLGQFDLIWLFLLIATRFGVRAGSRKLDDELATQAQAFAARNGVTQEAYTRACNKLLDAKRWPVPDPADEERAEEIARSWLAVTNQMRIATAVGLVFMLMLLIAFEVLFQRMFF